MVVLQLDVGTQWPLDDLKIYRAAAAIFFGGGGLSSAILRRHSWSVVCGPVTKVPLTFVLYQPEATPRRAASSACTWRADKFCIEISTMVDAPVPAERKCRFQDQLFAENNRRVFHFPRTAA
jgi:hypothetical protein